MTYDGVTTQYQRTSTEPCIYAGDRVFLIFGGGDPPRWHFQNDPNGAVLFGPEESAGPFGEYVDPTGGPSATVDAC